MNPLWVVLLAVSAQPVPDEATVAAYLKSLESGTKEERKSTLSGIDFLSLEQAARFEAPVKALLSSKNPHDRSAGFEAMRILGLKDLGPVLRPLLKSPEFSDQVGIIETVSENRMEEFYPALVEFYKTGAPEIRVFAAERLGGLGYAAAAAPLLAGLQTREDSLLVPTGTALGRLRAVKSVPVFLGMLGSKDDGQRYVAAVGLGWLGERKAIPALRAGLADPASQVRREAALSLSHLGAKEAIPDLTKRLTDADAMVRGASAIALSTLDAKGSGAAIVKLLDDPEPTTVQNALLALVTLNAKDPLPKIIERMRHPTSQIACDAVEAAARIGGATAVAPIKELWYSQDVFVVGHAKSVFFDIAAPEDVRSRLKELCAADASFLLNVGGPQGMQLNRIRMPAVWEKLQSIPLDGDLIGTPKEVAELIAKQAKLELVPVEIKTVHDLSWTLGRIEIRNPGRRLTVLDGLRRVAGSSNWWGGHHMPLNWRSGFWTVVLENDRIRFLPAYRSEDEGRRFWSNWIQAEVLRDK